MASTTRALDDLPNRNDVPAEAREVIGDAITEHKRAEEALRESQEFLSIIYDNSPTPVEFSLSCRRLPFAPPCRDRRPGWWRARMPGRHARCSVGLR
jgi:PAS domain-containing protein